MLNRFLRIVVIGFILAGCSKAAIPSIQALSGTLVQLKTSNASPFSQTFDTNQYAVFSGQCLNIITTLQISFNDGPWVAVPTSSTSAITGYYSPVGSPYNYFYTEKSANGLYGNYDVDCSDGNFNFWIYAHQADELIYNSLGVKPEVSNVYKVAIRGASGIYTTEPTVYQSSNSLPPSQITLQKMEPSDGSLPNSCIGLTVGLTSADGNRTTTYSDILFSLSHTVSGVLETGPNPIFYSTPADCSTLSSPLSAASLKIPANQKEIVLFYRVSNSAFNTEPHVFTANALSSPLSPSAASINFTIQPTGAKYIEILAPYRVIQNTCYPFDVNLKDYSSAQLGTNSDIFTVTNPTELAVYADSNCGTLLTGFLTVPIGTKTLSFKVLTPTANTFGNLQITSSGYRSGYSNIYYDTSNDSTPAIIKVYGMNTLSINYPSKFRILLHNSNGTPVPNGTTPLNLTLNVNYPAQGNFCTIGSCFSTSTATIPANSYFVDVAFKATISGIVSLTAAASGLASQSTTVTAH